MVRLPIGKPVDAWGEIVAPFCMSTGPLIAPSPVSRAPIADRHCARPRPRARRVVDDERARYDRRPALICGRAFQPQGSGCRTFAKRRREMLRRWRRSLPARPRPSASQRRKKSPGGLVQRDRAGVIRDVDEAAPLRTTDAPQLELAGAQVDLGGILQAELSSDGQQPARALDPPAVAQDQLANRFVPAIEIGDAARCDGDLRRKRIADLVRGVPADRGAVNLQDVAESRRLDVDFDRTSVPSVTRPRRRSC